MQMNQLSVVITLVFGFLALLLVGGYAAYSINANQADTNAAISKLPSKTDVRVSVPTAEEIAAQIPAIDNAKVDAVYNKLFEEDTWETAAETLAAEEWQENDNKDLFNWIKSHGADVRYREDISYVVIREADVYWSNAENQDAYVTQKLKVYYEDSDGDNKTKYVTVYTIINDGEVETQTFWNTP